MHKRIISHYNLRNSKGDLLSQKDVDFVNLYLGMDNPMYLDFNLIRPNNKWSRKMLRYISSYMNELADAVFMFDEKTQTYLLKGLHETNSTFLGMSKGQPDGNSLGPILKKEIKEKLNDYRDIIRSGNFNINTVYFTIDNIGQDRISDFLTSICKEALLDFTVEQTIKYSIPTKRFRIRIYNKNNNKWEIKSVELPFFNDAPVIFIPKSMVSNRSKLKSNFTKFITLGFNRFFKNSPEYLKLINNDLKKGVFKKDLITHYKSEGLNQKDIARIVFKEMPPENLISLLDELQVDLNNLSDYDLDNLVEKKNKKSN